MRILGLMAFIGALAFGQSALAAGGPPCVAGCTASGGSTFLVSNTDYALPDDGLLYNWSFHSDSAHPNVLISVQAPNEIFGLDLISNGDGTFNSVFGPNPFFTWTQFQQPGFTLIQVRGEASYNNCAGAVAGALCGYSSNIWGNGTSILVNTNDRVQIFASSSLAIPEPQTWLMMLAGLFGIGAAMRLSRRANPLRSPFTPAAR
jgi:hypothetical protein